MARASRDETPRAQSWWQTAPGVLTAVAGVLTALAGLLVAMHQVGLLGGGKPASAQAPATISESAPTPPASSAPPPPVSTAGVRYQVTLPAASSVTLSNNRGVGTYKVLSVDAEKRTLDTVTVKFSIRLTNAGPADIGFWNDSFRLLEDGVPRTPSSRLNEAVDARSAKEADVVFEVPVATKALELQINSGDETGSIPLMLTAGGR